MIKLHANLSKKIPIEGLDYSSQSFSAGIEVEMGAGATDGEIRERIAQLNQVLESAIDAEIAARSGGRPQADARPARRWNGSNGGNGNGSGQKRRSGGKATGAQLRAIFGIATSSGIGREDLLNWIRGEYGVADPEALTIRHHQPRPGRGPQADRKSEGLLEGHAGRHLLPADQLAVCGLRLAPGRVQQGVAEALGPAIQAVADG